MTRVKICGLTRPRDVEAAVEAGADAVGFVVDPRSPRYVDPLESLSYLASVVPPYVNAFAVYGQFPPASEEELFEAMRWTTATQVVEMSEPFEAYPTRFVAAVRPRDGVIDYTRLPLSSRLSGYILDAFDAERYGGTGESVDLGLAADFVKFSPKPVVLAGGLNAENVGDAIRHVRPYAVDVSTGVEESPGKKDKAMILDFIAAVRAAADGV